MYKGNVLVFESVRKEHRGTYYCVATNVVGRGSRRNVDVEVEFSPQIKVDEHLVYIVLYTGEVAEMSRRKISR